MIAQSWLKMSGITLACVISQGGLVLVAQSMLNNNIDDSMSTQLSRTTMQNCDPINDLSGCRPS